MATKSEARLAAEAKLGAAYPIATSAMYPKQRQYAAGTVVEPYMVLAHGVHIVAVFPASRRAAVARDESSVEWTDIDAERGPEAAREAVARYIAGEMTE